jgi:cytochrome c oxidase subunit 2
MRFSAMLGAFAALCLTTAGASATVIGAPIDGNLGLQQAVTPVKENIDVFHTMVLWIITAITLVVLGLLVWVMVRYNSKRNPEAKKFSHNTLVEVIWTGIPILILVVIAVPSFKLLYLQDVIPEADFTIKATGNQWNWTYTYPDHGGFDYVANMLADEDIAGHPFAALRNLSTDLPVVTA